MNLLTSTIDFSSLNERRESLREDFDKALPMRHIVIDNFLDDDVARKAMNSFPPYHTMERIRNSVVEKRASETRLDFVDPVYRGIFEALRSVPFISFLSDVTGFSGLAATESMDGAGLHQIQNGGFHNVHADKNRDPVRGYYHRISLIIYLNDGWRLGSPGALELWDRELTTCVVKIEPIFNRCIIFEVHDFAYHGYCRLQLAPDQTRKSLAMWYLSPEPGRLQEARPRNVKFALRPTDGLSMRIKHYTRIAIEKLPAPLSAAVKDFRARISGAPGRKSRKSEQRPRG
jgi:Rps23 Pro-64 3,4-dihydroxylase Tpa1-like proline 4-hydroxylase